MNTIDLSNLPIHSKEIINAEDSPFKVAFKFGGVPVEISLSNIYSLVQFWGIGQASAEPATPISRDTVRYRRATNTYAIRYRGGQADPNVILVGDDPGVRLLAAADASNGNIMTSTVNNVNDETLPDWAYLHLPEGYIYRVLLDAQHLATTDTTLSTFLYEVLAGDDGLILQYGSGYSGTVADPLGVIDVAAERTAMSIEMEKVFDCRTASKIITYITDSFASAGTTGNWYFQVERLG